MVKRYREESGPGWRLRLGRWQDVLADVEACDAVITDPPFSERTAKGYKTNPEWQQGELGAQAGIAYGSVSEADIREMVTSWSGAFRRWMVVFGDHISARWASDAMADEGLYPFAPLPWVKTDAPPRFLGDGPASMTEWIQVARHRSYAYKESRGSRPGYYIVRRGRANAVTGTKDVDGMRAIVRDYSEPGDLVVDPCAGGGTTLLAAAIEGRTAIGAECDPDTYELAVARLQRGYTPCFDFAGAR